MITFDDRMRALARTEDCPLPEGFQARLSGRLEALPRRKGGRLRLLRGAMIAAACAVALTVSALALSPTLRELLTHALGSFAPYTQEVEGVSATDRGIRISVVRAIADENGGRAWLEVTDLTGDRLEAGLSVGNRMDSRSYDPDTRTAIVEVALHPDTVIDTDGLEILPLSPYTLNINAVYPTKKLWFEGVRVPWELISNRVLDSYTATDEESCNTTEDKTVLTPNQTPMALEGTDLFTLSSMGWDDKGSYHIQIALAAGVYDAENSVSFPFDARMAKGTDYYRSGNGEWCFFRLGGGRYVDIAFHHADEYELEELLPKELEGYLRASRPIPGSWELTFSVEELPERTVTMREKMGIEHMTIEEMTFTALGFQAVGSTAPGTSGGLGRFPVKLYLADGSTYGAVSSGGSPGHAGGFGDTWRYDDPLEPENIVGVCFGYWYIPIDGAQGGPGYWLTELPQ